MVLGLWIAGGSVASSSRPGWPGSGTSPGCPALGLSMLVFAFIDYVTPAVPSAFQFARLLPRRPWVPLCSPPRWLLEYSRGRRRGAITRVRRAIVLVAGSGHERALLLARANAESNAKMTDEGVRAHRPPIAGEAVEARPGRALSCDPSLGAFGRHYSMLEQGQAELWRLRADRLRLSFRRRERGGGRASRRSCGWREGATAASA